MVDGQPQSYDARSHRDRVRAINKAIRAEERRLRERHGWLGRQDLLGVSIWLGSLVAMGLVATGFLLGVLPWWVAVPLMTLPLSLLHELEHDLIHDLYLSGRKRAQDVLFLGIFLAKGSMDPWLRRVLHLRHHKRSGQKTDVEERLIGLGLPYGPKRLLMTLVPAFVAMVVPELIADIKAERRAHRERTGQKAPRVLPHRGPLGRLAGLVGTLFALLPFVAVGGWFAGAAWATPLLVLYVLPNTLRHFSIALVSSSSHYYGDLAENDVFVQNQILDHPAFWPLQLFCFNFGATHVLHHYVVPQPFYLRQLVAWGVRDELVAQGVRRNDLGTFGRANRYGAV